MCKLQNYNSKAICPHCGLETIMCRKESLIEYDVLDNGNLIFCQQNESHCETSYYFCCAHGCPSHQQKFSMQQLQKANKNLVY